MAKCVQQHHLVQRKGLAGMPHKEDCHGPRTRPGKLNPGLVNQQTTPASGGGSGRRTDEKTTWQPASLPMHCVDPFAKVGKAGQANGPFLRSGKGGWSSVVCRPSYSAIVVPKPCAPNRQSRAGTLAHRCHVGPPLPLFLVGQRNGGSKGCCCCRPLPFIASPHALADVLCRAVLRPLTQTHTRL